MAGQWSEPIQFSGQNGAAGSSPAAVYQGDYDSSKTYYGTPTRVDIVKYNSIYYVARTDGGVFFVCFVEIKSICESADKPRRDRFAAIVLGGLTYRYKKTSR